MLANKELEGYKEPVGASESVKILLVDDKEEDLMALELVLKRDDYKFVKATSGRDALRILLKESDFAIILMDVHMPLLDGFETARMIREREKLKNIPIIFLTANNDKPENIFKGYETGAVDYMIKPIVPDVINAKMAIFTELYRKTNELEKQKSDLLILYRELEKGTKEITRSNKELEKFAYVASHDMQEPLRTIISYLQLLQERFDKKLDLETEQYMHYVIDAGYRMRDLITGLLEYSRINNNAELPEKIDINAVLSEVSSNLYTNITESKAKIITGTLPIIKADHLQMVQLFQNLVNNAIKFSGSKTPEINVTCIENNGYHQFCVKDAGIGMESKYSEKIFEIFQRLHPIGEYPGMGIGLAICKKIVERHGGKIWVESEPGKGSSFFFTIAQ